VQGLVYERGALTVLAEEQVVKQVVISYSSQQKTAKGIRISQTEDEVRSKYGAPTRVEESPAGRYLVYDTLRLAFAIREGIVVSWFVFQ
jgi:hypothetical protein